MNLYSCICYTKLFEAAKIHSNREIHMLFEHGFYLTKPIWPLICLHDVTQESFEALTDHFANTFVRENDFVATL